MNNRVTEEEVMQELKSMTYVGNPIERYTFIKKIGQGASAAVYKAKDRETGWTVAVKKIYLSQQSYKEDVITELLVLREIKHPNVISYLDSYLIGDELWASILSVTY
ncbi:serine/threonine-protein kinase PAK 3-like [Tachypleus tridentatus]|uniref:serine/threonine-protein kinase PAK 3-like n=1 Tax=Tachypleus tridentatus TaxID=6853 RepID=UPI003FD35994